jgi:ferrochelatase
MARRGPYEQQLHRSAELIAQTVGAPRFKIAFQSRSGSPAEPWLEPDVRDVLRELPRSGVRDAVVVPVGFLCDHVEVLYDLDVDAQAVAKGAGVRMVRAAALNDHPLFIRMLADLVQQCRA